MKKTLLLSLAIALLCIGVVEAKLITAKDLAAIMNDENVVIISGRTDKDYKTVHIEGAIHIDLEDLYKPGAVKGLIKSPEELAAYFGGKGVSESSKIVLYCNKGVNAGRLYWILEYLGAKDIRFLDGQMKAWRKARKPVTKDETVLEAVTFTPTVNSNILATMSYVKAHKGDAGVVLVDVRTPEEYNGEKGEASRHGHIPGAINFDNTKIISEEGDLVSVDEMKTMFNGAGITADKEIILYCETSGRTGVVYMVLTDLLGYKNVKVYDGGMFEWAADASNPLD